MGTTKTKEQDEFIYTASIEIFNDPETLNLFIRGKGILPQLKLLKSIIQLGECSVNDHSEDVF